MSMNNLDTGRTIMTELRPRPINVLIIEDEDPVRQAIADILAHEGYHPLQAPDGRTGLKLAREAHPDIIVCDVFMPEMDGFKVLMYLRQETGTASIPVIFVTADTGRACMRRGMELGADDFIIKPFTSKELLGALKARMARKGIFSRSYNDLETGLS